jgi:hypothetical protein
MERVMSQPIPSWRTDQGQTLWLSRLIETMEKFSRPDWRSRPVDRLDRIAMVARLGQPAMAYATFTSRFNLRN